MDHPRVCGEKTCFVKRATRTSGSPPRMRGKVARNELRALQYGITPAYAGKRAKPSDYLRPDEDHPRICGEKKPYKRMGRFAVGSPPHMRGKVARKFVPPTSPGITPAYAGKSLIWLWQWVTTQDHPRICGEKKQSSTMTAANSGSPPHMRGKGCFVFFESHCVRITPAYAGKRRFILN